MPTYGYECTACKHKFEVFQKITDEPLKECELCKGPVRRILYPVGIVFKGSGFYVNDSHSTNPACSACESHESCADSPKCESAKAEKQIAATSSK